ncbi:PhzF family phenazine biosynthesis protein [Actinocorallia longicatena]|uniref:PhzF family phenazine biosynthesis protein n=2 Tax=Actinocorallia longicatena TaxID=111803 RepID=A0ABP6QK18_9ACTN
MFVVDAFTGEAFAGNPAGVCLLDAPADEAWMLKVAAEMKHSETAFVRRSGGGEFELRWFTPAVEVRLCGHATLGAAHALFEAGLVPAGRPVVFRTRSGPLTVTPVARGYELDFPAKAAVPVETPDGLLEALGVAAEDVLRNDQNDLLVVVADAAAVRGTAPDFAALAGIDARGVCVTAPGEDGPNFVSRFFAPAVGVEEDPVTGSAHCMLAPYWAERLGRTELAARQLSARGGSLRVTLRGDRVLLGGEAVTVLDGELRV